MRTDIEVYIDKYANKKQGRVIKDKLSELLKFSGKYSWLVILFIMAYILNPLDTVPDLLPAIGFLDDLMAILIAIETLRNGQDLRYFNKVLRERLASLKARVYRLKE